jgi:hypothetical protein
MGFATRSRLKRTISIEERRIRRVRDAFGRCGYEIIMNKQNDQREPSKISCLFTTASRTSGVQWLSKNRIDRSALSNGFGRALTLSRFFGDLAPVLR